MNRPQLPRADASLQNLADAFTMLCHVLGERARDAVRKVALQHADNEGMRNLLKCMNDFERVDAWRVKNPEAAKRIVDDGR